MQWNDVALDEIKSVSNLTIPLRQHDKTRYQQLKENPSASSLESTELITKTSKTRKENLTNLSQIDSWDVLTKPSLPVQQLPSSSSPPLPQLPQQPKMLSKSKRENHFIATSASANDPNPAAAPVPDLTPRITPQVFDPTKHLKLKATMVIHDARAIDATHRDSHIGLPRNVFGFLFHSNSSNDVHSSHASSYHSVNLFHSQNFRKLMQ